MWMQYCLYDAEKSCTSCGECDRCDLDPDKICDNCCQCIDDSSADYAEIAIDDMIMTEEHNGEMDA